MGEGNLKGPEVRASVREMTESDLPEARRTFRRAFGTFLGAPDPDNFWPDRELVFARWRTNPAGALAAHVNGEFAGSNFLANWGSFGFFGPLTIRPELWNRGIAQQLLGSTVELFESWGVRNAGLFTFAQSTGHVHLYQKFGFWPRFLTAVMAKPVHRSPAPPAFSSFSRLSPADRSTALEACRSVTNSIYEGLDLSREIRAVTEQRLGETVLLWGDGPLEAFAICHCGEGTEAGARICYVKFAAVRPGAGADKNLAKLLECCEALAADRNLEKIEAGVNLARSRAYRLMLERGFRNQFQGVAMQRPDEPGYNRPDAYILDDWR